MTATELRPVAVERTVAPGTTRTANRGHDRRAERTTAAAAGNLARNLLQVLCVLVPIACLAYTVQQFPDDPQFTDKGLVPIVSLWYYAGLALCGLGFWLALQREPLRGWLLATQLAVFVVVIHALPALAYDVTRPFWAFKHIGVVDYIVQNESVDRSIDVYHNWPGFFALSAIIENLTGLQPDDYARWSPLFFNLLWCVGLLYALRTLTDNARARRVPLHGDQLVGARLLRAAASRLLLGVAHHRHDAALAQPLLRPSLDDADHRAVVGVLTHQPPRP
jgi:hypothetical protein